MSAKADRLARALAEKTGKSITQAVTEALRERLARIAVESRGQARLDRLNEIVRRFASLPVLDPRPADEILGYDENGLPT